MKRITVLLALLLYIGSHYSVAQKIGLLMDSYVSDRWYIDQKYLINTIRELGGECIVEVPYGDPDEQLRLGKKLIEQKVEALIIIASDTRKAVAIVEMAKKSNVPVISYDRLILSNDISYYISFDNEKVGRMQAEYALSKVPSGHFVLLNGPKSDYNAILFRQGQLRALDSSIRNGNIKVVGDFVLDDWSEILALMKMDEELSTSKRTPDAIIAANDALANGAILALSKDQVGKVVVTGQDADPTGVKNIIQGNQSMTVYKPIKPLAMRAAEIAMILARKGDISNKKKIRFSDIEVYAELLAPLTVDKNNYKETVVKDGHVSLSEVIIKN
jgi:D-xylose transport system substrate-binding protein